MLCKKPLAYLRIIATYEQNKIIKFSIIKSVFLLFLVRDAVQQMDVELYLRVLVLSLALATQRVGSSLGRPDAPVSSITRQNNGDLFSAQGNYMISL